MTARRAERPAATHVSYIPSHMPVRISRTLPGAQGAADITARGGRSKDSCLKAGGADRPRRGDPRGSTARTYVGASQQAERSRSREGTHAAHAGGALAHVNATSQSSSISSTHGGGATGATTATAISMSYRSRIAMHQPTNLVARRAAQTGVGLERHYQHVSMLLMLSGKHRKASFKVLVVCEVDLAERLQPHSTVTSTDACAMLLR